MAVVFLFMTCLCAYRLSTFSPKQMAHLAGMFSLVLHLVFWQMLQAAAMDKVSSHLPSRIEVVLMSELPKPVVASEPTKPLLPVVVNTEEVLAVAIPLPVADEAPIVKPLPKLPHKISKPDKAKSSLIHPERRVSPSKAAVIDSDRVAGGSAGGYGVAAPAGEGVAGSIGFGGGVGNGAGSGYGSGNALGVGSGNGPARLADADDEADYKANYATNPKPKYPELARNLGWEGSVLLRVSVSAEGRSEQVSVHRSSGYKVLDDAAAVAVQKWRFAPARRGGAAVASVVIVPIGFALK